MLTNLFEKCCAHGLTEKSQAVNQVTFTENKFDLEFF